MDHLNSQIFYFIEFVYTKTKPKRVEFFTINAISAINTMFDMTIINNLTISTKLNSLKTIIIFNDVKY